MPWRRLFSDPAEDDGARPAARALRDVARLTEQLTGASAVILSLTPDRAAQLGLGDCMIGDDAGVDALLPLATECLQGFAGAGNGAGAEAQPPAICEPLIIDRTVGPGGPAMARALFLRTGACAGVLALCMGSARARPLDAAARDRISRGLDLLGATVETLLNDRLRDLELRQRLAAVHTEMQALQRASECDPLTGLTNIKAFESYSRALLQDSARPALLVLFDIDRFKAINDRYGHQFGDLCLRTVAGAVRDCAPEGAVVGRLGGDEFGVVLPLDQPEEPAALRRRLDAFTNAILRVTAPLDKPGLGRVSIGAAQFPRDAADYEWLYNRADLALYASKSVGHGAATLYDAGIGARYDHAELAKTFRDACRAGEVVPYFQPMVDLETGAVQVLEVLCRWNNPRHGLMAPEAFPSIFTDPQFASDLTRHMARESLAVFAEARPGLAPGVKLSLNLTYFDLMDREFVFDLQMMLAETGVGWSELVIEVQETVVLDEGSGQVFRSLTELRRRGAEIALDDYGTGYGTLTHLQAWPVDMVKIDRSFVGGIGTSRRDRAIVTSILQLSQELGFRVVAEGVEGPAQAAVLRDMGCDLGQGYGLGYPMEPADLLRRATPRAYRSRSAEPGRPTGAGTAAQADDRERSDPKDKSSAGTRKGCISS